MRPSRRETGSRVNARRGASGGLKRVFEGQHEAYRPSEVERQPCHQRLDLRPALAAEAAAWVGCNDSDSRDGKLQCSRHDTLKHVRMLSRAPHGDAVGIGRRQKRVRLDREMRDHRKRIVVLDDEIGRGVVDIAPAELPLLQRIGVRERIAAAQRRRLHERRAARRVRHRPTTPPAVPRTQHERGSQRASRRPRSLRRRRRQARLRTSSRRQQASADRYRRARSGEPVEASRRP